jgi:hypothetical protein
VPAGSVISQSPAAGTSVAAGTAVNLVVSSGPASVDVPRFDELRDATKATQMSSRAFKRVLLFEVDKAEWFYFRSKPNISLVAIDAYQATVTRGAGRYLSRADAKALLLLSRVIETEIRRSLK